MPETCRFCSARLKDIVADLGLSPVANRLPARGDLANSERFYPLRAYVCRRCWLVQIEDFETPESLFCEYSYFSSFSESWLRHAKAYVDAMMERWPLGRESLVVEVASNDGYLLQYFRARGVAVLGVEPAANVARVARRKGVPTRVEFFGLAAARRMRRAGLVADLLLGNNVLAHVPDLNDFVAGLAVLLKPSGVITLEFPHLLRMIRDCQFDMIYHEHFSYFSLGTASRVLSAHGLEVFDLEEIPTHGGSLRVFARHAGQGRPKARVSRLLARERRAGLFTLRIYRGFMERAMGMRSRLLAFLDRARRRGLSVAGYGAPAKASTLLNYCGIHRDLLSFTVDRNPYKQGRYLPGVRIPILPPAALTRAKPDYILILPWNLRTEVSTQLAGARRWGGRLVLPLPKLRVLR